ACTLLTTPLRADEAVRPDGHRVRGTLSLDKSGKLTFTPARGKPLPTKDIAAVLLDKSSPRPFRVGGAHALRLRDGQRLSGRLVGLEKGSVTLRTAWAGEVAAPRAAVASVTHLPGWRTLVTDDLDTLSKAWAVRGKPAVGKRG